MSLLGQGTPADDLDAYLWVQSAVGLGHEWLRPALEMLERNMSGADSDDRQSLLASLCPVTPSFRPCSLPGCDPSRCNVA
jgi:hypothetical protein